MSDEIAKSYHAHVYYDHESRKLAESLRSAMETLFPAAVYGRWHDKPVGPHPSPMFQIAFEPELFAALAPWLILNHGKLTIFLHPNTGDPLRDHAQHAVWMGRQRELNLDALKDET